MSSTDLPFVAEYAKSSRSSCKLCKSQISKDDLRIGVMVQSPHFDGKVPLWHHFKCFFEKKKIEATGDIGNFSSLRYEDQQRLKEKVGVAPPSAAAGKKSKSKPKSDAAGTPFSVEYAKSSRSSCKVCSESIQKGVVRISKLDYESEIARRYGPSPAWHHVDCFVRMKDALGFTDSAQDLPGFSSLEEEDQKELKAKLKGSKSTKKRPPAVEEKPAAKKVKKEESSQDKALKAQSDLLFGFRDALEANLQKNQMVELLELNNQAVPSGVSNILDALADCLAFGALKKCPECQNGLRFKDGTYKCSGYVTGWTKCVYETKSPERSKFVIPDEYKDGYDFLKKYKYVKRSRIFPEETNSGASTSNGSPTALHNMKIALAGFPDEKTAELQKLISSLGGEYVPKVKKGVTCVVASEDKKEEYASAMKRAKQGNVTVVSESFLDAVKGGGKKAAYLLKEHSLKPWGIGMASEASTSKKSGSKELKSAEKVKKVVVQGVAEVDPDSGLADEAHVLTHKNDTYNCVLGMVDVARGTNSYYKLQILKHNKKERYYVFRAWGRVGTTVGGNKTEKFDDRSDAVQNFQEIYLDKTGNEWADRANFVKKPNRFYPLDIDYGQDQIEEMQKLQPGSSSKLSKPVQELICLIFDVAAMKKALMEFEIDLQKMPLGKLSKNQIMQAYSVLSELQKVLQDGGTQVKIVDASNRFYTLIPHDFGMVNPPLLDSEEAIKSKTAMLDSLLEIECAYKLLKSADDQKDPVDHHYEQLKADIEVLDKASGEFKDIETYLKNTHAPTHSMYNLVLEEVFKVNRHGEAYNYRTKYSELQNKKLLWHGSRITNFAGIISQGLRIAPPEAPVTGYMFGKGIYFADMVSKSANYCFTNRQNPTGLLLLCEVALGDMYERTRADFITKLPSNKHSTKGLGKTVPDPKGAVVRNGVEIPCGKPVSSDVKNSALLYNEYIVYDVNQVNAKYLLRVRFDWK